MSHDPDLHLMVKALRQERDLVSAIFNSMGSLVMVLDRQGRVVRFNQACERATGYAASEVTGKPVWDLLFLTEEAGPAQKIFQQLLSGRFPLQDEKYLVAKDGSRRRIAWSLSILPGEDGAVEYIIGAGLDLTSQRLAEDAAGAGERLLSNILHSVQDGFTIIDRNYQIVRSNPFMERLYSHKAPLTGKQCHAVFHGSEFPCEDCLARRAMETGEPQTKEFFKPDGVEPGWMEIYCSPLRDTAGNISGVIEYVRDITRRKLNEEAKALHARRLQAMLDLHFLSDASPQVLQNAMAEMAVAVLQSEYCWLVLPKAGAPRVAACAVSKEAVLQDPETDGRVRLQAAAVPEYWAPCFEQGKTVLVNDYPETRPPAALPPGRLRLRRLLAVPIFDGSRIAGAAAVANKDSDYTGEDVQTFTALLNKVWEILRRKDAEDAFQILVNNAPVGIFIVQNGVFKVVNPGFAQMGGYSSEELLNNDSLNWVAPEYREGLRRYAISMLKGETHTPYEFPITTKNGETKWVMEKITSTVYQGQRAVLGYFLDISERRRLEAQLLQAQKMEAVGRLAGGVAHDFNNILGLILGYTEVSLMNLPAQSEIHQNLAEVKAAAQRGADLVRQLLGFARKQTVRPRVMDLNDAVAALLKMLHRLIGEDIHLGWKPGRDVWPVKIDPSQVDQILANLMVNARDAIAGVGRVAIETANVRLTAADCAANADCLPGDYARLQVSDNGQGMDRDTLTHIFEPFFTTKESGKGTGLGLSTVYGIVRQNHGFINVYSEPGQGTAFKIYLPRFRNEAVGAPAEPRTAAPRGGTETLLVVEDEEKMLDFEKTLLESLGYKVLAAGVPAEALRLAEEYPQEIHLLITDVVLPGMNGRELAQHLAAIRPRMKCLYMSGHTAEAMVHRGILTRGLPFIQKPFPVAALAGKIREVLEIEVVECQEG